MDKELFAAIKWATTLVRKNFNLEDLSMQERGHIKVLNTALQNAESLPTSTNIGMLKLPLSMERCTQLLCDKYGRSLDNVELHTMQDVYLLIERQLQHT